MADEWLPGTAFAAWVRRTLVHPDDGRSLPYLAVSFDSQGKIEERDRVMRGGR
jgi:hypothetical protein